MNKPVPNTTKQRQGQHARLALYLTIGFFMVGVAVLGYAFLGPSAGVALGAHVRPVDVATNGSTGGAPTGRSVTPAENGSFTSADLANMQAEMNQITRQANTLIKVLPVQGGASLSDLNSQAAQTPMVSISNTVSGLNGLNGLNGLPAPVPNSAATMSTLEEMMSTMDQLMSAVDVAINNLEAEAGTGEAGSK